MNITTTTIEVPRYTLEMLAAAAHMVNRAFCIATGDFSQPTWENTPEEIKETARAGVLGVLCEGDTPRQSHERWLANKAATGWVYGAVKDPERKEHPCMVPYDELPPEQRAKDDVFIDTVQQLWALAL